MRKQKMPQIHPREALLEDYLKPLLTSQSALARALDVPADDISEIVRGRRTLPVIPRFASHTTSTPRPNSGAGFRLTMRSSQVARDFRLARSSPRCRACAAPPLD